MVPILIALAMGLPWLGALVVWLVGDARPRWQHALAVGFAAMGGAAALALLPQAGSAQGLRFVAGPGLGDFSFQADGLGVFLAVIASVIGSLAVLFSVDYMRGEAQLGRYYALVLVFIGAMVGLVLTSSLLLLFVFWELTALCSYALISFHNDDPKAVAGGIKALIITQVGGVGLLAAALLAYGALGTYDMAALLSGAAGLPAGVRAGLAFGLLAAAAAKSAQFPFHTWLPDAMEAPTPVSALIHAATMVNAGVYVLLRFYPAFADVLGWTTAVTAVGVLTALLAALMALVATDLKRVLAYSTVSQLGYMVAAVGVGGLFAAQFHLLSHAIFKALLFLAAGAVIHAAGTRDLRQMGGLGRVMPRTRAAFVIGALALAGLPILDGFWSKELILESALTGGPTWAYAGLLVGAGLTALYTLRCTWLAFYGPPRGKLPHHDAGLAMQGALLPLALGALLSELLAGPLGALLAGPEAHGEAHSTLAVFIEVLTAPATYAALAVVALGLALWPLRRRIPGRAALRPWLSAWAEQGYGLEPVNRAVVRASAAAAEVLRGSQTGLLAWNVAGILLGLAALFAILLLWGA